MSESLRVAFRGHIGGFVLDAAFEVPARGVTALFGPSGCGKTTVLRCIAGLQRIGEGVCVLGTDVWQDAHRFLPTHRRPIGFVFQEASLFAHLSVRRNLQYGSRSAGDKVLGNIRFDDMVALLGLERLLDRSPRHLSGGERQRVAIGRALLSQPRLLLMDEPLAALDRAAKDEILPFLERLQRHLALPVVYVSHDIAEASRLADHLVLMQAGRVLASGPIADVQSNPALGLAQARDAAVSLDAIMDVYDARYGIARLRVSGGHFLVPSAPLVLGEKHRLRILAHDVSLAPVPPGPSTISNALPARILSATGQGPYEMVVVLGLGPDGTGARLLARVTLRSWELLELSEGMSVHAQVKAVALV